ncbi:60S ribosome subunit biogenesis protein NIP7-like protein [Bienertia sinuspersici]
MLFLYGNAVLKAHLWRITKDINVGDGVVVYSMFDIPLGFGIATKSTKDVRKSNPQVMVVIHRGDIGEYLRMEDEL